MRARARVIVRGEEEGGQGCARRRSVGWTTAAGKEVTWVGRGVGIAGTERRRRQRGQAEKNTMGKEPQLRVEPRSRHRDCGTRTSQASAVWSTALHFKAF